MIVLLFNVNEAVSDRNGGIWTASAPDCVHDAYGDEEDDHNDHNENENDRNPIGDRVRKCCEESYEVRQRRDGRGHHC